jgi:NAD(P)-dependent dehydrogenase (short-subunit alcohol dehydrogenase family)
MYNLKERVALVTGAGRSSGIGAAIARRLAQDGAHVVVADICAPPSELPNAGNPEWDELVAMAKEIAALGVCSLPVRVDVSNAEAVQAMIAQVQQPFGRLDILVNNAGVAINPGPVAFMDDEAWRRTLAVNATGTFLCCKYALAPMIDGERGGRIINMASLAAERPKPFVSAYAASKAAVVALTRSLAQEVAQFGVTVNAVLPGDIDTAMKQWGMRLEADAGGKSYDEMVAAIVSRIPLARLGTPTDVAQLVAFLASDEASFITGQAWIVSGGREWA